MAKSYDLPPGSRITDLKIHIKDLGKDIPVLPRPSMWEVRVSAELKHDAQPHMTTYETVALAFHAKLGMALINAGAQLQELE